MADNAVEIVFRTKAELAGANAFRDSLERQIGAAKAAGKPFADLEQQLARVKISLAGADKPSFLDKLGPLAGGALGGMVAGFTSFAGALTTAKAALDKFAGAEQNVAKLDAALAQANLLSDSYREKLQGLAHGSEQWLAVLTRLTQFDAKPENIESYMQSVKDLAGVLGGDVEQAAHIFSLALQGNFEMLHRYGIHVDESKTKVEQLADAQAQMALRGRGQIDAANEGIAGGFRKVNRESGNLREALGRIIAATGFVQTATDLVSTSLGFLAEKIGGVVPKLDALQDKFKPIGLTALEAADQQKKFAEELNSVERAAKGAASGLEAYLAKLDQTKSLEDQRDDALMKLELARVDQSGATGSKALEQKARITQKFATRKFEREQALDQQKIDAFATDSLRATDEVRNADAAVKAQTDLIEKQKRIERAGANAQDAKNHIAALEKQKADILNPSMAEGAEGGIFHAERNRLPGIEEALANARRITQQAEAIAASLGPGVKGKSAADLDRELRERLIPARGKAEDRLRESAGHDKDVDALKERQQFRGQTFGANTAAEFISQSVQISNARTEEANKRVQEALKAKDAGIISAFHESATLARETAAAIKAVMGELSDLKEVVKTLRQPP